MNSLLIDDIHSQFRELNSAGIPVIFVVTGLNGSGKTTISRKLIQELPFYQTLNLGAVSKTLRHVYGEAFNDYLDNFKIRKINDIFTDVISLSCEDYKKNGVNVIIDGVQVDTNYPGWDNLICGGVILSLKTEIIQERNDMPETHFNRIINKEAVMNLPYAENSLFDFVDNSDDFRVTYTKVLCSLSARLAKKIDDTKGIS